MTIFIATFKSGDSSVPTEKNGDKISVATFVVQIARFDRFVCKVVFHRHFKSGDETVPTNFIATFQVFNFLLNFWSQDVPLLTSDRVKIEYR